MAGTASNTVRSASIAETVAGTIPATPAWQTSHSIIGLSAVPNIIEGRSQLARGGRAGQTISGIDVTGTIEEPLRYGVLDGWFETLMQGAWTSNVLKNGELSKTRSVELSMAAGVGGTLTHLRYRGVEAISGTLSLTAREAANVSLELFGLGTNTAATTIIAGATYTDPTEIDIISSGSGVGTITMAGYAPLDCMESLEINFAFEGREGQPRIASDDFCGVTRGAFVPTMVANMYVEGGFALIRDAALNNDHAYFAVTIPLGTVTGKKYLITFPKCKFGMTEMDASNTSVMQEVTILPHYDSVTACVGQITRAVV